MSAISSNTIAGGPEARTCGDVLEPARYAAVEILVLPDPAIRPGPCPRAGASNVGCGSMVNADLDMLLQAAMGVRPTVLRAPTDPDERTRYRWAVGHHAAFAVWQCLREALDLVAVDSSHPAPLLRRAARLYDVYSVLFLYTGSCSAKRYAATVRGDMLARHPAFSGEWARDFEAIPALTKRVCARYPGHISAPLVHAARLNHRVHMAVAKKLVPDGASLFRQAGRQRGIAPTPAERDLYDEHFAVHRNAVCFEFFKAQFVRRLAQVVCDIAVHGLTDTDGGMAGYADDIQPHEHKAVDLLSGLAEEIAIRAADISPRPCKRRHA